MTVASTDPMLTHILCLPDLFRLSQRRYSNGYYDLVREPIRQGTGLDIGHAPETRHPHRLAAGFDATRFRALAGVQLEGANHQAQLADVYHQLNSVAEEYLFEHIPPGSLLFTMEIPPWLAQGCIRRGIDFLDFAISPLRFGRDLYAAVRTSSATLFERIYSQAVSPEEIQLEASTLAANVRMHQATLQEMHQFSFQNMNGGLLFLGQAPSDASLIAPDGRTLTCADFADRLQALSQGKKLFYKGHPYAPEFSEREIQSLTRITGKPVEICLQNAYQVLGSDDDLELTGISSGLLQEAARFGKTAHTLFQPFVPLTESGQPDPRAYQQIHFGQLLAPAFWHSVLTPEQSAPRIATLPVLSPNHMRETFGLWWDYSKVMTWERPIPHETVMRGGVSALRQRIEALESNRTSQFAENRSPDHDFSLHSGERQVATRYEDIRADHRYRYEWVDARLPVGGSGIDAFCGNGYGTWQLSQNRHVWGIDGSVDAIRLAEQHYRTPKAFFSQAFYPFDLPGEQFDFAVSLESIEHVEAGEAFFATLVQSLKPGGLLFFSTPCEERLPHAQLSEAFHFHYKHYTFEQTRNLALAHGLEIIDWAGQDVYALPSNGKLALQIDPAAMQLKAKTLGQFLIFFCRKGI